ncbi:MAG: ribosome recycling factor [Bacilli bacterium]|nr:ribosome recycling factor [Bacilli bacterium]
MDDLVIEAKSNMDKTIEALKNNFAKLRSGRANPAMLRGIQCDYYGEKMDIASLSSINMPEPRQLVVKPYSREDIKAIATALQAANLGINPQVEADCIRLIIPPLTEDVRRDIAKQAKGLADDAKVAVRNIRRDYLSLIKDDDSMSDDYKDRVEEDIQKVVDASNKSIDELLVSKQKEIMTI